MNQANLPAGTVVLENVSKSFKRNTPASGKRTYSTVKSAFLGKFTNSEAKLVTHALENLNLEIRPGHAVGIIGRNGSGKSTLLKIIAGIYQPDSGTVNISGRVSALIELGAGFHPDFTGRENVYLGGVMFGMTRKEIDNKFDEIVSFAELESFIDDPVRTYSSGMYMRLGFSLAIHTNPDILLVDEVLAVGDASFIHRCQDRISDLKRNGKTLIFVTHDLDSVKRWCEEAIWLNKGVVECRGQPQMVVDKYLQNIEVAEAVKLEVENATVEEEVEPAGDPTRWGNGDVEIESVKMFRDGAEQWLFHSGDSVVLEFHYKSKREIQDLVFGVGILRADGLTVFGTNTDIENVKHDCLREGTVRVTLPKLDLVEGTYFLDIAAHKSDGTPYDYHHRRYKFSIRAAIRYHGVFIPQHRWEFS